MPGAKKVNMSKNGAGLSEVLSVALAVGFNAEDDHEEAEGDQEEAESGNNPVSFNHPKCP